jgi:hypothetical protein
MSSDPSAPVRRLSVEGTEELIILGGALGGVAWRSQRSVEGEEKPDV